MAPTKFMFAVVVAALTACGGGGDDGGTPSGAAQDDPARSATGLFRSWTLVEGSITIEGFAGVNLDHDLNLTGGALNSPISITYSLQDLPQLGSCNCAFTLSGNESLGTYTLNNCVSTTAESAFGTVCNSLNETGTFEHDGSNLRLSTSSGDSLVYQ